MAPPSPDAGQSLHEFYHVARAADPDGPDWAEAGEPVALAPLPPHQDLLREKAAGCLLGVGVGDALGRAVEGRNPSGWRIEQYQPWGGWQSGPIGTITDDTQMTLWLAESLLDCDGLDPEDLTRRFTRQRIRGIGRATREFVVNVKEQGLPWQLCGVPSAGNGVAMRSAPLGLFYADRFAALKLAAGLQALVTHREPMAIASGIAVATAVALLLRMEARADLGDLASRQEFSRSLGQAIAGIEEGCDYRTRRDGDPATLTQRLQQDLPRWLADDLDPLQVNDRHWSGAYVLESLPLALYCFLRCPGDFQQTLLDGVNASRDSDTVGAIACAFSGTLNGRSGIPPSYLAELEFREALEQTGQALVARVVNR